MKMMDPWPERVREAREGFPPTFLKFSRSMDSLGETLLSLLSLLSLFSLLTLLV
jgi:hypothetical protein